MKFIPMLFSTPMVQALLAGTKTQTRRNLKFKPFITREAYDRLSLTDPAYSDYWKHTIRDCRYQVGDVIWVRETWRIVHVNHDLNIGSFYTIQFKDYFTYNYSQVVELQDYLKERFKDYTVGEIGDAYGKWKPSLFMPKEACRLFLEVNGVRIERLQDISKSDAIAEGIEGQDVIMGWKDYTQPKKAKGNQFFLNAYNSYATLWTSINGPDSWEANPFVWVYEFKRIEKPASFQSSAQP